MVKRRESSRRQFAEYLREVRQRKEEGPVRAHSADRRPLRKRVRSSFELMRAFLKLLRGQRAPVVIALTTVTISTLLGLVPPAITKFILDYVLGNEPLPPLLSGLGLPTGRRDLLVMVTVGMFVVALIDMALHVWGRWHATRATKRMQVSVRRRAFEHAVRLPLNRVQELKSGGVASVLREDAGSVADLIFGMLYNPWRAIIQLLGSICVLAWIDWRLLVGVIILLPAFYLSDRLWFVRVRPRHRDVRAQRERVDAHTTEAFGGIRVVRGFTRENSEKGRFQKGNHLMARQELNVWWWTRTIELIWQVLIPIGSAAILLYGGLQVLNGRLTIGDLMMFLVYLLMLLEPLATLAASAAQFQASLSGLDRILDLLAEPREMPVGPTTVAIRKADVAGRIAFEGVSFQYPGTDRMVLQEIDLEALPGQTIALVGPSGAGKTTLCNLVARFYDPAAGSVRLDGRDLREIAVDSYRALLGIVEQDVFLFDGTVAENIGYGSLRAPLDEIREAAQIANAAEFIEQLPEGYDTLIGERGVKLSGGQRQRLAIARAVLADPKILILDEATSNLDTESERLIQQSLLELMRQRTCFVIAHRLSTIAHADRIVVLEGGRIREVGTHAELMATDSRYREMVELQTALQNGTGAKLTRPAGPPASVRTAVD